MERASHEGTHLKQNEGLVTSEKGSFLRRRNEKLPDVLANGHLVLNTVTVGLIREDVRATGVYP